MGTRGSLLACGQMLGYDGVKTYCKEQPLLPDGSLGPPRVMEDGPLLHVIASFASALFGCTFSAPADIVMTRYQAAAAGLLPRKPYNGVIDCVRSLASEEGAAVFYRG